MRNFMLNTATNVAFEFMGLADVGGDFANVDYDFVAGDTSKLADVADGLRDNAKLLEAKIEEIYTLLESFPKDNAWSGATYVKFYEAVLQYKPVLESLIDIINSLANICEGDVSNDVITLQGAISRNLALSFERGGHSGRGGSGNISYSRLM